MLINFILLVLSFLGVPDSTQTLLFCQDRVAAAHPMAEEQYSWRDEIVTCMKGEGFVLTDNDPLRLFVPANPVWAMLDSLRFKLIE